MNKQNFLQKLKSQIGIGVGGKNIFSPFLSKTKTTQTTTPSIQKTTSPLAPNIPKTNFSQNVTNSSNVATSQSATSPTSSNPKNDYMNLMSGTTGTTANPFTTSRTTSVNAVPVEKKSQNAYIEYLKSMFNPEQVKLAQKNMTDLNERIAKENKRAREQADIINKNEVGQLEFGQNFQLREDAAKSSRILSDLSAAYSASEDIYNKMIEAGATVYEAEMAQQEADNKPLSFEEAQALQVPFGTTIGEAKAMGITPTIKPDYMELSAGATLYDPATGRAVYTAPKQFAPGTGGGAGAGNTIPVYDAQGNVSYINTGGAKLSTGQQNDVADMLVLQEQIKETNKIAGQYGGYKGTGAFQSVFGGGAATSVFGAREGAQEIRNEIGQIKGFIAKLRGGTSFTPNEQKLLDTYTPKIGDSDGVIESKLKSLNNFINNKIKSIYFVAGGNIQPTQNQQGNSSIIVSPDGQQFDASELTPEELNQAIADGYQLMQ